MAKSNNSYYASLRKDYPRTWRIWYRMNRRCEIGQSGNYVHVEVCDEWNRNESGEEGFINFVDDMGPSEKDLEIDRINPFGNYEPGNCRWTTRTVNQNNTRWHHTSERAKWKKKADANGIGRHCFYARLARGWNIQDAATLPPEHIPYRKRIV